MNPLRLLRHFLAKHRGLDLLDWVLLAAFTAMMLRLFLGGEGCKAQF